MRHILLYLLIFCFSFNSMAEKPALMLPKKYYTGIDIQQYWISEKLDGVRARWNGQQLISRGGHVLHAPDWFIADFPPVELDGELWLAHQRYADTWSIVSQKKPHAGWRKIHFMLFDLPKHQGQFNQRLIALNTLGEHNKNPYLSVIPQFRLDNEAALITKLNKLVTAGSEGLILHHQHALYRSGRSHDILKLKPTLFAEATVIGYRAGKGKFTGLVGSLQVRTATEQVFHIGSGLSHAERKTPPPIGSVIRFKYQGHTKTGLPRFPVFLEQLTDKNPS
jgi:DNA ligase-1